MSTEAEIVTYAGHRYRVAGRSTVGTLPEPQPGTVCRGVHSGRVAKWPDGWGGEWRVKEIEILAPLDPSPPAETPRCEAPGWCGLRYHDPRVPFWAAGLKRITPCSQREPGPVNYKGCTEATCDHPTYCSPVCADRARAAAGRPCHGCMGERGYHLASCPFAKTASPIPAGYRLAKGWKVLETPGRRGGGTWRCWSKEFDCPKRSYETLFASDMGTGKGACLDCAERRGAIERVCVRAGCSAGAASSGLCEGHQKPGPLVSAAQSVCECCDDAAVENGMCREHGELARQLEPSRYAAPCLSHHPELGSRCERKDPHDSMAAACWGYRPGTGERVTWARHPVQAETRAERWIRTHPGYGDAPSRKGADRDWDIRLFMVSKGMTANVPGSDFLAATNHKPAPWTPGDPEADIPWVWER